MEYSGPLEIALINGPLDGKTSRHPLAKTDVPLLEETQGCCYRADADDDVDENGRLKLYYKGKFYEPGINKRSPKKCFKCRDTYGWIDTPEGQIVCAQCGNTAQIGDS